MLFIYKSHVHDKESFLTAKDQLCVKCLHVLTSFMNYRLVSGVWTQSTWKSEYNILSYTNTYYQLQSITLTVSAWQYKPITYKCIPPSI